MRDFVVEIKVKAGTVFNVTATLNGYQVIPSDEEDPNAWHGKVPDKKIPLLVAGVGVMDAEYDVNYHAGSDAAKTSTRKIPEGGVDIYREQQV